MLQQFLFYHRHVLFLVTKRAATHANDNNITYLFHEQYTTFSSNSISITNNY